MPLDSLPYNLLNSLSFYLYSRCGLYLFASLIKNWYLFFFQCKFDFCWVCQESWKRHSSATGGYFRCNRFEAVHKADEKQGSLISEAVEKNNQMQEMSRFLHFYTRFKNHENSMKLEEPLLTGVRQKMEVLASSLGLKGAEGIEDVLRATKRL